MRSGAAVPFLSSTSKEGYDARNVAVRSFERSQSCRNLFYSITVFVDSHRAGGGRNRPHPVTRHRNTGGCSERVAHFLCGLYDPLWLCWAHYVLARISRKCRCAKCEREHDTRAPNRRTAQAAKPVFHSHAVIVIPFRILGKLNLEAIRDKETTLSALRINPLKKYSRAARGDFSHRGH
jgi:hypothetical protein